MGRAVAYPDGVIAVEVDGGAVLGELAHHHRAARVHDVIVPRAHNGFIYRNEKVSAGTYRQQVEELDPHRSACLAGISPRRYDSRPHKVGLCSSVGPNPVSGERGAVHLAQRDGGISIA